PAASVPGPVVLGDNDRLGGAVHLRDVGAAARDVDPLRRLAGDWIGVVFRLRIPAQQNPAAVSAFPIAAPPGAARLRAHAPGRRRPRTGAPAACRPPGWCAVR